MSGRTTRGRLFNVPTAGVVLAVVAVVAALALTGCDSGSNEQKARGRDLTALRCPMVRTEEASGNDRYRAAQKAFDTAELVGMGLDEARQKAARHGCEVIVALKDGKGQPVPIEIDPTAIYVYVEDGAVKHVERVGGGI